MKLSFLIFPLLATFSIAAPESASEKTGVALTIYNQNFGVVRDTRKLSIIEGSVRFQDVAKQIDPTSVHFLSLTDPAAKVLEQNYEYDLVSADKLLEKYIDREITIETEGSRSYSGRLQSFDANQIVLDQGEAKGLTMVQRAQSIRHIQFGTCPKA